MEKEKETEKEQQIISRERTVNHGEVLTARREVEAMLDLVKNESERIDSRFLEPACGNGNFLVAILERKLNVVTQRYKTKEVDFEVQMLSALSSIYGIDLLDDNVLACRERLLEIALDCYKKALKKAPDENYINIAKYILSKNILQGDSLNGVDKIIFTQWSLIGYKFKREEYSFSTINQTQEINELPLFKAVLDENKEPVFIPQPIKTYPLTHYKKLLGDN